MRNGRRVILVVILFILLGIGVAYRSGRFPALTQRITTLRTAAAQALGDSSQPTTHTSATTTTPKGGTPIESVVQAANLHPTYYYHFSDKLPAAGIRVFNDAIDTYNRTGIVHLVEGTAANHDNRLTFSVYYKQMSPKQRLVELGHGGPEIIQETSTWGMATWNHATASLNGNYRKAYTDTVAIHELGHALGLGHSKSRQSVMYPYSEGRTRLAPADLTSLKAIYRQ
ncbi:matrixin family metalloprotease [Levilactobacillus zymae]|uniref:matrixin family metalloprotease n=1 Tax=Levilactobacillus zymae TaxID=267363 RepID=UPI0028B76846|nr:matrixin family metalloprotease [Levilactobacillus zymae]MDT6979587.1 matrixin family metalloprotease [Levilactobacillus zymae]